MNPELQVACRIAENLREGDTANQTRDERAILALYYEVRKLRADKARLDLLDRNAVVRERALAIVERGADHEPIRWAGIEWDGRETTIRQEIDFHRNR